MRTLHTAPLLRLTLNDEPPPGRTIPSDESPPGRVTPGDEPPPGRAVPADDEPLSGRRAQVSAGSQPDRSTLGDGGSPPAGPAPGDGGPLSGWPAPGDGGPLSGWAVLVDGDRIEAVGPVGELTQAYPTVRVRRWPGTLGPALVHDGPLPPAPTPRERVHALLRSGVGAVLAAHLTDPAVRAAAARNDVAVLDAARPPALTVGGRADLAVFAADGRCLATVVAGRLVHRRA
ncbi:imidazolonepropionase-like domain-containing protein [Micromonospora wenchangensis]|uniref:imidazolonepropionase-like domain-containing protein n=1 Tax=Micromonospora wenchangensis TaxID=1185415 RepID=UPI0034254B89